MGLLEIGLYRLGLENNSNVERRLAVRVGPAVDVDARDLRLRHLLRQELPYFGRRVLDSDHPLCISHNAAPDNHAAFFSSAADHSPRAARLFMRARCRKACWPFITL